MLWPPFARAAADAKRLGFDMVELHGAHGYLIDQFFWAGTNERTDRYGGATLKERSRFAAEVVLPSAPLVPDLPVSLRVSQWKQQGLCGASRRNAGCHGRLAGSLVEAGANLCIARSAASGNRNSRNRWRKRLELCRLGKEAHGAATISVGSVSLSNDFFNAFAGRNAASTGLEQLTERMERDEFDLIAVGRALISDPNWVEKVRAGATGDLTGFEPSALSELV